MGKTIAQSWVEEGIAIGMERGMERGLERGREQGLERGRAESLHAVIRRHGHRRFGEPSPEAQAALEAIMDSRRLLELSDRVWDVASWEELLAVPSSSAG
jgi:flagellar biosynthesis/type III secretory pathway protein FliH